MSSGVITDAPITLSERAVREIQSVLEKENRSSDALRIFVADRDCSGYKYGMGIDDTSHSGDTEFVQHGLRVVIDATSLEHMIGTTVEYVEDEHGGAFRFENPNAANEESSGGCGCGCRCGCGDEE